MNRFSVVFFAVLLLLSMQKKNAKKENATNVSRAEKQDSDVAASSDISSEASIETLRSSPYKNDDRVGSEELKKDEKAFEEVFEEAAEKKAAKEKTGAEKEAKKAAYSEKRAWKDEIEAIKIKEEEMKKALKEAQEKARKSDSDEKSYKESVSDLGQYIVDVECQIARARDMLKAFNEDIEKKKKDGEALYSATLGDIRRAKEETKYLNKLCGILKKWKLSFCDHFLAICRKNVGDNNKIAFFVAEKEGGSSAMFYGGIAVVLSIAFFVLGYCFGGRKN